MVIEGVESTTFKFIFSHEASPKKLRQGTDNIRFPLLHDCSSEIASRYFPFLAQGIIDHAVKQMYPLYLLDLCENDWKKLLQGFLKGKTPLDRREKAISEFIFQRAQKKAAHGRIRFEPFVSNAWKKGIKEDPILKKNRKEAALAMTLTACKLLSQTSCEPVQLQSLLKSMQHLWLGLKKDSSFSVIAKTVKEKVPVQVILAVCELSAHQLLGKGESSKKNRAWRDAPVSYSEEEPLKLSLMARTAPLYLTFSLNFPRALAEIQKYISICPNHHELLNELFLAITEETLCEKTTSSIKELKIPKFESLFPSFFQQACLLFRDSESPEGKKELLQQVSALIIANFTLLSEKEKKDFFTFSKEIDLTPSDQKLIELLQLMGSSQVPQLNRAAFAQFKLLQSKQHQIDVARSLSEGGDIISTARAFDILSLGLAVLSKEKKREEEVLNVILENILDFEGKISHHILIQAIDILLVGLERLCENERLTISTKHRLLLNHKLKLLGHHALAELVLPSQGEGKEVANSQKPSQQEVKKPQILSKEELFKLAESGDKDAFYKLRSYIQSGELPHELKSHPTTLWDDLFLPLLEKAATNSPEETSLLVRACLPYLKTHFPPYQAHISFVTTLIYLFQTINHKTLKKNLILALSHYQTELFPASVSNHENELSLELANVYRQNNIPLHVNTLCHLFSFFPDLLNAPQPKTRNKILALFITLKEEEIAKIFKGDVLKVCRQLILAYVKERFDISLDLFVRFPTDFVDDHKLLMELLNHIPADSIRKYEQFIVLSQAIKDPSTAVLNCWNQVFLRLFLKKDSWDIHTHESFKKLLDPSLAQMINGENRNLAVSKILKTHPHSPRFAQCLTDSFTLIQQGVEESRMVEFFKKLLFSRNSKLVEEVFSFSTTFHFTSPQILKNVGYS